MSLQNKTYIFNTGIEASSSSMSIVCVESMQPQSFFQIGSTSYVLFLIDDYNLYARETMSSTPVMLAQNVNGTLEWVDESYRTIKFTKDPTTSGSSMSQSEFESWVTQNAQLYVPPQEYKIRTFVMPDGNSFTFKDFEIYQDVQSFPATGSSSIIYLDATSSLLYYWTGSGYTLFSFAPKESPNFTGSIKLGSTRPTIGTNSVALGNGALASGNNSIALSSGNATGAESVALGSGCQASEARSFAQGEASRATASCAVALGGGTTASAYGAFAEGVGGTASGYASHKEGYGCNVTQEGAHAEGRGTRANGAASHAEGQGTIANGVASHVGGSYNIEDSYSNWAEWVANTLYSVGDKVKVTTTENNATTVTGYICKIANSDSSFTASNWDVDEKMNYAEIIGNGTTYNDRSNIRALDWKGNEYLKGDIYLGCNADSSSGSKVATESFITSKLNVTNITSSTTIASLCSACPVGEHRYYRATASTTFTDFPSSGTFYYPVVHIYKMVSSSNGCEITINSVTGQNVPVQHIGWFENNVFYWEQLALKSDITSINTAISKLKNYTQITGSNKTDIESALVTFSGNMVNGEQRAIYFANGTASAPMMGTTYIGMIGKQENRLIVQVHGISAVYQDLTGFYKSGTGWEWYSLYGDIASINTPSLISVSDFNSLTTPGRYSLGGNYTNAPKQNLYGYVDVVTYGSNTYAQTVYSFASTGSTIYERRLSGSTWGSWEELALKSHIENLIKYVDVDISGISITQSENGHYYYEKPFSLPSGTTRAIGFTWNSDGWNAYYNFVLHGNQNLIILTDQSRTVGTNKVIRVYCV